MLERLGLYFLKMQIGHIRNGSGWDMDIGETDGGRAC